MAAFMDRLKSLLYEPNEMLEPVAEPTLLQRIEDSSTLTTQQRLIGMGIAGLATCVCWSLGSLSLLAFKISSFITMFTLGNISALAATCFLVGPKKQLQNMSQRDRWVSALVFTVAMIVTLIASIHHLHEECRRVRPSMSSYIPAHKHVEEMERELHSYNKMYHTYFSTFFIVLPCMVVQMAALIWYCLTYIPGGQGMLMGLIGRAQAQDSVV